MERKSILRVLRRPDLRRLAIWTVLVLMLVSSLAVVPDDVEAQGPGRKDITFYLHNVSTARQVGSISTLRVMNTTVGDTLNMSVRSAKAVQYDFYLHPVLANDTAVEGNVTVNIWARRIATSGDNRGASFIFSLYDVNAAGVQVATIASRTMAVTMLTAWTEYQITASNVAQYTVAKGHTLRLYVEFDGSSSNDYQMAWGNSNYRSRVVIEMTEYVRVDSVKTLDHARVARITFDQLVVNKTIIFLANITDPYGGYDVRLVNCSLVAPNGTRILDWVPMQKTQGFFNTFYNEYERTWNYSGFPTGQYNLTVHAVDNSGWYYRYPDNPGDATFGGHLESMTVYFWIGGMPHNVNVTVLDDSGAGLGMAQVTIEDREGVTDASGNVTILMANGTYTLSVYWQKITVYTGQVIVSGDTNVTVTARVYSPELIALDDLGNTVKDAVFFLDHPNGTRLKQFWRSDASGSISLDRMAGGDYGISVLWQGVEVHNATVTIDSEGPISVRLQVYVLDIEVQDEAGDGLELAQVVITHNVTGIVADSKLTDLTGVARSRLPVGDYDFVVYWRNVVVFDSLTNHRVDYSGTLVLTARIFAVNLHVEDTTGVPVATARVVVGFATSGEVHDFGTTDDNGELLTKLPAGYYNFWVYWKDILVNTTISHWIDASGDHTIVASIYWVDMTFLDARDVPVYGAIVTARHEDGQDFGTKGTDAAGRASYRLPGGSFDINVTWLEFPVYDDRWVVDSNNPWVVHLSIYYLDLQVVDTMSMPIEGALVTIAHDATGKVMGSTSTDAAGNTTYRLPIGDYRVSVSWQESRVYSGLWTVDANRQEVLVASVYYLFLTALDSRDVAVEGAQVTVTNSTTGRIMGSPVTDDLGNVTLRLPMGTYRVRIVWQETVVYEAIRVVDTNDPVSLNVAVFYVDLHIQDTMDVAIEGALVTFNNATTGRSMGTQATNATGDCSYRVPIGTYDLAVVWQEEVVHSSQEVVVADHPLLIVAQVYYAFITVIDTTGEPLTGAQVSVVNPITGRIMGSHATDSEGKVAYRLPLDDYEITVVWLEMVVYSEVHTVDTNDPLTLVATVYYAVLTIVDSIDAPLETAIVTFTNATTDRLMDELSTGADGEVTFRLPMGLYELKVVWQEAVVFLRTSVLDANDPETIRCNVFYGELRIIDSMEEPLESALVSLTNATSGRSMGDRTTGSSGIAVFRVPMGLYTLKILWIDTVVYEEYITVDSNVPHTIIVAVYYPEYIVQDSRDVALNGALVTLQKAGNGRIMGSHLTDSAGSATFRVPIGTYTVTVVWLDTLVHEDDYDVHDNTQWTVAAMVYYVEYTARDSRAIGLEFAQIQVKNSTTSRIMGSHTADLQGVTEFRLPVGMYAVDVMWQHAVVYRGTWTVTDDAEWDLDCWVYYIQFHVMDAEGVDLAGASVSMANVTASTSLGPLATDTSGVVEFRLPLGDVSLAMVWQGVSVYEAERLAVTEDAVIPVNVRVYYLTVKVIGSDGVKVHKADVNVLRDGAVVASDITPKNGTLVFRLPGAEYSVKMTFRTTYHLTWIHVKRSEDVDLTSSTEVKFKLTEDEYPIPFLRTNLFLVILALVILIVLLLLLTWRIWKTQAAGAPEVEAEAPEGSKDDDIGVLLGDLDTEEPADEEATEGEETLEEEPEGVEVDEEDLKSEDEYSEDEYLEEEGEEPEEYSDEDFVEPSDEEPEEYDDEDLEK